MKLTAYLSFCAILIVFIITTSGNIWLFLEIDGRFNLWFCLNFIAAHKKCVRTTCSFTPYCPRRLPVESGRRDCTFILYNEIRRGQQLVCCGF